MKLPITRESLRAFDPAKEKNNKDEIAVQNHINLLVQGIADTIENRMLWTMPKPGGEVMIRPSLADQEKAHKQIMNDRRFIWDGVRNIRISGRSILDVSESVLIQLLVEKLKETFIGCDIIVDPLKTYIIIDWS
jgi:hypothetical protein